VVIQIFYIRITAQKPKKLVEDRLEMEFFGREQRKIRPQRVSRLRAEDREGAGAGAIFFKFPLFED
jgi:hypothetical protein